MQKFHPSFQTSIDPSVHRPCQKKSASCLSLPRYRCLTSCQPGEALPAARPYIFLEVVLMISNSKTKVTFLFLAL